MSSSQTTSAVLGGFAARHGVQLVQEVPASVASAVGLVGLSAWWVLSSRGERVRKFVVGGVKGRLSYMMKKRIAGDNMARSGREDEEEFVMVEDGGSDERDGQKRSGSERESADSDGWDHVLSDDDGTLMNERSGYIKSDEEFEDARDAGEETLEEKVFAAILSRDSQTAINMLEDGEVQIEATDAYNNTLLMLATQSGAAPVVAYLLDRSVSLLLHYPHLRTLRIARHAIRHPQHPHFVSLHLRTCLMMDLNMHNSIIAESNWTSSHPYSRRQQTTEASTSTLRTGEDRPLFTLPSPLNTTR